LNNTAEARKLALQAPVAFLYQPPPTLYVMVRRHVGTLFFDSCCA
jgi:hypothetical protein